MIQDPSVSPLLCCGLSAIRILWLVILDPVGQFKTSESQLISNLNSNSNPNASLLCNTAYSRALKDMTYLVFMLIWRKKGCSSVMLIVKINAKRVVLLHLSHVLGSLYLLILISFDDMHATVIQMKPKKRVFRCFSVLIDKTPRTLCMLGKCSTISLHP